MNMLLHRLIPALLSLSLPFSLQAEEASHTEATAAEISVRTAPDQNDAAPVSDHQTVTDHVIESGQPTVQSRAEQGMPEDSADTTENGAETESDTSTDTATDTMKGDRSFTISTLQIEGNLLLPVEAIEEELKIFLGDNKTRDDLFAIRYTIIKTYRKAELSGVAVAVPTSSENGTLLIRIFEDDIDAYPQSAKESKESRSEISTEPNHETGIEIISTEPFATEAAASPTPEEPISHVHKDEPGTSNLMPATKPASHEKIVKKIERPMQQTEIQSEIEKPETYALNVPKNDEPAVLNRQAEKKKMKTETAHEVKPEVSTKKIIPVPTASSSEPSTATENIKKEEQAMVNKVEEQAVKKAPEHKHDIVTKKPAKSATARKAVKATKNKPAEEVKEVAPAPAVDLKQSSFDITSFEVFGNSLIPTNEIQNILKPYIGTGKSYADLVNAKQEVSQLYRKRGYKMVAIGMPATVFGETIPVRIYELKRKR